MLEVDAYELVETFSCPDEVKNRTAAEVYLELCASKSSKFTLNYSRNIEIFYIEHHENDTHEVYIPVYSESSIDIVFISQIRNELYSAGMKQNIKIILAVCGIDLEVIYYEFDQNIM